MTPPRIKLLAFTTVFAIGGTERHLMNVMEGLDHSRFELEFGCLRRWGQFLPQVEARGVPITEYPVRHVYGARALAQQVRFARHLGRRGVQIVHTYGFYANVFGILAARLARTPVVIASIRDTGYSLTGRQQRVQRLACRFAHHVLVNAQAVRRWLVDGGYDGRRISVIRNGLDVARFTSAGGDASLRRELALPPDAPIVAMVSRLNPLKGVEDFLAAAARVADRFEQARFLIIGDNGTTDGRDYRRELERHVARLGLQGRVVFTGFRLDVPRLLAEVAVCVHPSLSEGLPNAVLESMAAGVPVVATRVGGSPELVRDGVTGFLVPPQDPAALAKAIDELLSEPDRARRLGQAGRRRVAEHFSLERMVKDTERLYESLLTRAEGRAAAGRR
jgi:L-malate glycosyltransferase